MDQIKVDSDRLKDFCAKVFQQYQVGPENAEISADVLVTADMRGIPSHGTARLGRYINGLREGLILPSAEIHTLKETPVSLLIDAEGTLGAPVSRNTMKRIIEKAHQSGMAFGCVKNSNHFGIAGYYAMMALPEDMIGVAMTNTAALGVPTNGSKVMFGTNPLAFAAPANREESFVLDMSTTVVTRGKVEVYDREGKKLSPGWAVDSRGLPASNPASLLDDMFHRRGGGLVPLGGDSEANGGHKGYGLAVMIDILTGLISGSAWGSHIFDKGTSSARVSHCFGAMKIDLFMDAAQFRENMDAMLEELRSTNRAEGADRVYYAGLKEAENYEESVNQGVVLTEKTARDLKALGESINLTFPVKI